MSTALNSVIRNARHFSFSISKFEGFGFDWQKTQRNVGNVIIPYVLHELKSHAPVSQTKPDAGRFRDSMSYIVQSTNNGFMVNFVSTTAYAPYVLHGTKGGAVIVPKKTQALRFSDGFGGYVFAKSVWRADTPPNNFNIVVANKIEPILAQLFKECVFFTHPG